jgi:structural maintenance of chromosome 2
MVYDYIEARNNASHALTEIEQAKLKISHLKKELKEKEPLARKAKNDSQGLLKDYESAKKAVQDLTVYIILFNKYNCKIILKSVIFQTALSKINWNPSKE